LTVRKDEAEKRILDNTANFGSVTPENAMKWDLTEPTRNHFEWEAADAVVDVAVANGQEIHCHNLVWHSRLPCWVLNGNWDNATLIDIMTNHITKLAGQYKGKCTRWDVLNEGRLFVSLHELSFQRASEVVQSAVSNQHWTALNENGTFRDSVWYKTIGEAFIPIAFRAAAEADPGAKLYYNDYNLEFNDEKTAAARRIVELIQSYGVRIDGVGFQAHLSSEITPTSPRTVPSQETLTKCLQSFADLGVDVAYTEVDIRMELPATKEKLKVAAEDWSHVVGSCMAVDRCVGITTWVSGPAISMRAL
jgi:endo-1,4-beta-xylanase